MYSDLGVAGDSEADLQERFVEWKNIFGRHDLIVSLEKTEVHWVGHQKNYGYQNGWEEIEPKRQPCISG